MPKAIRKSRKSGFKKKRRTTRRRFSRKTVRYNTMAKFSRYLNQVTDGLGVDNNVLTVVNNFLVHKTSQYAGVVNYGAFQIISRLVGLPGYTDFTNLYEDYRFDRVVVKITPMCTAATTQAASTGIGQASVLFHWVMDYDDMDLPANSAAGLDALRQKQGYRVRNILAGAGRPLVISFKPRTTAPVYISALSQGYQAKANQWLDTANPDIPHFGIKCVTEAVSAGAEQFFYFKVETKYYMSFKGVQ